MNTVAKVQRAGARGLFRFKPKYLLCVMFQGEIL